MGAGVVIALPPDIMSLGEVLGIAVIAAGVPVSDVAFP